MNSKSSADEMKSREHKFREEDQYYLPGKSLCIAPLPKTITREDLAKFLRQFGPVKRERFGRNSLWIEYYDSSPVNILMSKSNWFPNEELCLRRIKKNRENSGFDRGKKANHAPNKPEEEEDPISYDRIKGVIESEVTFDNQLTALLNTIQLTEFELITRYDVICTHLNEIFRPIFPECRTYKFGSTVAGLSFKESDLDIYMYVGEIGLPPFCHKPDIPPYMLTLTIFKRVRRIMYSMKSVFSNIISIPKAKTPIIKFRYIPTNVSCDISFKNGLDLQKTCVPHIINGWQVNFNENTVLPPISNSSSIAELFHDFFSFYATFHFHSCVICLLDGKTYSTVDFTQIDKLPDYMDRYKTCVMENSAKKLDIHKPLCLQDPIELNQNTAAITSDRALIAFQQCCVFSAEICAAAKANNYENVLKTLFSTVPPQLIPAKKRKTKFKSTIRAGRFLHAGLPDDFDTRTDISNKEQYKKDNWYFMMFNLIRDIFEMIFKLQVEILVDQETKQQKVEVLSDVHTRNQQKITFHCTGNKCVWYNRKKNNRTLLDVQLSLLEKEAIMSDKVMEQLKDDTNNIKLDFICTLEKMENPVSVIIILNDEDSQNHIFRQFECFVNSWIPKIIQKTLLHMLQFKKTYSQLLYHKKP
ncbi:speckle targeted PIP5K1A-regulated poly(A) polymerase-like isoform X2 [Formica exsecta]|uniref:speckle targeted PIP5K1A-regulated poly(A) polymerase-like isoform X2 n=1 Tax=Formica exsecta TaxID=72781 RepID=UPI0011428151|nr:speckle targeted PIP5K1A-regulated poly(A) polymerase-like isoform X2 [Formica exsecta]